MIRVRPVWESSRLHGALAPYVRDSVVLTGMSRLALALSRAASRRWRAADRAFVRALRPDRARVIASFSGTAHQLRAHALAPADRLLERLARASDHSVVLRRVRGYVTDITASGTSPLVAFIGIAWLSATLVHAALAVVQNGVGRWPLWGASAALAILVIINREAVAGAWTAAVGNREPADAVGGASRGRVLVITPFPEEGAGYRFRIGQYIPHLVRAGFDVTVAPFFTSDFFKVVYRPGNYLRKIAFFCGQTPKRLALLGASRRYDLVFIYREAFPIGPAFIERALARRGLAIVYDFDDAIFLGDTSDANRFARFLKDPAKTGAIASVSSCVVAGNDYLADYARRFNDAVIVIPTCVDTAKFVPRRSPRDPRQPIVVGWIGSPTTIRYLLEYADVLAEVARDHPFILRIAGAGRPVDIPGVRVQNVDWSLSEEVSLFNTCDIGVYPLADDAWTLGKCGFKAIQFMACGVPVIASAVGVNREIVRDGANGLLASVRADWVDRLTRLLTDEELRGRLGQAGRRSAEERYSLQRHAPVMIATLERALARAACGRPADET